MMILQLSGGVVSYKVNLGRNDSKTASIAAASTNLPPSGLNLTALISFFKAKGFNARELVALSGSPPLLLQMVLFPFLNL